MSKIRNGRTWHGLGSAWIGDTDELFQERRMLLVVPIAESDSVVFVIRVCVCLVARRRVQEKRRSETVDVLTLHRRAHG